MDIPPPPRSGASFRPFYERERPKMIALVGAMSGDRIYDPEQTAENGWHRFYPYWKDCDNPQAYLRRCVVIRPPSTWSVWRQVDFSSGPYHPIRPTRHAMC